MFHYDRMNISYNAVLIILRPSLFGCDFRGQISTEFSTGFQLWGGGGQSEDRPANADG